MYFNNPSYLPFSLSAANLQKSVRIIRGTGNCPHFRHTLNAMFWLLLSNLLSVSEGFFKAAENCIGQIPI